MPIVKKQNGMMNEMPDPLARTEVERQALISNRVVAGSQISKPIGRDFEAEARGKVTCAAYVAAVGSPALASLVGVNSTGLTAEEDFERLVHKFAKLVIEETWRSQNQK